MGVPSDRSDKLKTEVSTGCRNLRSIDDFWKSHLSRVAAAGPSVVPGGGEAVASGSLRETQPGGGKCWVGKWKGG